MAIRVPTERTYYQSSPTEPDRILYWIPRKDLEGMVRTGEAGEYVLDNYPDGLEVEVSKEALEDAGIKLNISPENICKAYALLKKLGDLPDDGYVKGEDLENFAKLRAVNRVSTVSSSIRKPGKPKMSDGEEPSVIFQRLVARGGS